ncbi:uncharacterized protein TNCV_4346381 [Trichonephila clavipes]|nr:uncharacterized protein TNCV_4346381 [Trichonephila clavipes]
MAFILKDSPECVKSELELFNLPGSQTVIQDGQWKQFHPLSNVFDNAPVEFHISGSAEDYIDLSQTQVYVKAKRVKVDNTPITKDDTIGPKYGKFTEDCIPDGVFPIGDDVFVFASTYYDSVSVHIRRFKKYGKTYYPTPEGITLDPRWIEYIMRKKKVPESLEELPSGPFSRERHIQITKQWAEMIKKYGAIENAAIDNMFQCMDFLTAYKTFCEGPIENTLPSSLDVSLGQQYLTQILKKSICSLLNEKGLKQPQTFAEVD